MKKIIFSLIAVITLSSFSFGQFDGTPTKNIIKFENLIDLPVGSKITFDKIKNTFNFTLSEDNLISGIDSNGHLKVAYDGSITCKCTKGSGCNPFIAGGGDIVGCTVTSCSACSMTASIMINNNPTELNKVTIIDNTEKIHFITEKEELLALKCPQSSFLDDKWFENEINNFVKGYQVKNIEKARLAKTIEELNSVGYILMPVNVYGYAYYLPVQKDLINSSNLEINSALRYMMDDGGARCTCNVGSGCSKKSKGILIGSATWCEAGGCSSCTLSY